MDVRCSFCFLRVCLIQGLCILGYSLIYADLHIPTTTQKGPIAEDLRCLAPNTLGLMEFRTNSLEILGIRIPGQMNLAGHAAKR